LPQRTRAAQIAWTFRFCSAKGARPGSNSAAIAAVYAGTQFQARPEHEQRRNIRLQVLVRDNNVDQALKALKKKMQREGIFREMKLRGHYEKPSEKKARERAEAIRRARKLARKKMQREGLIPGKPKPAFGAAGGPGGRGPGGPGARPGGFGGGGGGGGFSRGPR
jgi:small subunit ribosomal protein S21